MELESDDVLDPRALGTLEGLGGPELVVEMIDLFLLHGTARVETALEAERQGDLDGICGAAHSLSSTAGTLGARALQKVAVDIEALTYEGHQGDVASISPLMRELERRFAETCSALEARKTRLVG